MSGPARPTEIADGVVGFSARTPTLPPATHTESYALGSREVLLVEPATPYEDEQRAWLAWARGLQSAGRTLVGILLTHHHEDHVGGATVFRDTLGVPLLAHGETARALPFPIDRRLGEGDTITLDGPVPRRLQVYHTPGHARGHLCLLGDDGTAVVGDMVATEGTILVPPGEHAMSTYLRELRRMCAWGARLALPAHGAPILDPAALFERYIAHRLGREAKIAAVFAALGTTGGTLDEVLPRAYDDAPPRAMPFARLSLEAHVEKLEDEGRLTRSDDRWFTTREGGA